MNRATLTVDRGDRTSTRAAPRRHRWRVPVCPASSRYEALGPVLLLDVLCGGLVAMGRLDQAVVAMWGQLALWSVWFALRGRPGSLACLVLGASPFINLLRNVKYYSGVPLLFTSVLLFWLVTSPREASALWQRARPAFAILAGAVVYYALSFSMTGDWHMNMRVFELACAAVIVVMAAGCQPLLLRQALWGLLLTALAVSLAAYPSLGETPDMRLGFVAGEEQTFGNPFALGAPLAVGFLLLSLDRGSWLGLEQRWWVRLTLVVLIFGLLALTASRAGWLLAVAGIGAALLLGSRQRFMVISTTAIVAVSGFLFWDTPLAEPFRLGWVRTFGEDRSLSQATSLRSDQWVIFWHAWTDSPQRFLSGYGPGSATQVMATFTSTTLRTRLAMGSTFNFHSQWLHVGVEWGLLGLSVLLLAMGVLLRRSYVGCRHGRPVLAFSALTSYCCLMCFSICFDSVSGSLLGLGLLANPVAGAPQTFLPVPASTGRRSGSTQPKRRSVGKAMHRK